MAKKLITFNATFQGTIEIDTDDFDSSYDMEDILCRFSNEELFAGCETDLSPEIIDIEEAAE
jgi:hypothetical protein